MEACMLQPEDLPGDHICFHASPKWSLTSDHDGIGHWRGPSSLKCTFLSQYKNFKVNKVFFHRLAAAMAGGGRLGDVEVNPNICLERVLL